MGDMCFPPNNREDFFFMKHVRRKDKLGNLLRILTDAIQLQSGLIEPVLVTRVDWTKWVEATWLGNLK